MTGSNALAAWVPGLDDGTTLGDAYAAMPGDEAASVPWRVRVLENPSSKIALPGAVDLFGHDCIHIVLGRGTMPRDEAFVLGVTMGASGKLSAWQQHLFTFAARHWYRGPYQLANSDLTVFRLGVEFGRHSGMESLHSVRWRDLADRPLGEIRRHLGIDSRRLGALFECERVIYPHHPATQRLPRVRPSATSARAPRTA